MNDLIMYLEDGTLPGDTVSLSVWRDARSGRSRFSLARARRNRLRVTGP